MMNISTRCAMLIAMAVVPAWANSWGASAPHNVEGMRVAQAMEVPQESKAADAVSDTVYTAPDTEPQFPGGTQALINYIAQNIKYPAEALKAKKEGRAIVKFVIDADGGISDVAILRSTGDATLDAEAVRVIKSLPRWTPGTLGGKPVRVRYNIPLTFNLHAPQQRSADRY